MNILNLPPDLIRLVANELSLPEIVPFYLCSGACIRALRSDYIWKQLAKKYLCTKPIEDPKRYCVRVSQQTPRDQLYECCRQGFDTLFISIVREYPGLFEQVAEEYPIATCASVLRRLDTLCILCGHSDMFLLMYRHIDIMRKQLEWINDVFGWGVDIEKELFTETARKRIMEYGKQARTYLLNYDYIHNTDERKLFMAMLSHIGQGMMGI